MSLEDPQPVKGTLTRKLADGTTETIEMTVEEVQTAPERYSQYECHDIIVTYEDGSRCRPYRFVESNPEVRFYVDPKTGRRMCSF